MICRICGCEVEIPPNAILLRDKFGSQMWQFPGPDRAVHEFKTGKPRKSREKKPAGQTVAPVLAESEPEEFGQTHKS